jgi:hypothetical protein
MDGDGLAGSGLCTAALDGVLDLQSGIGNALAHGILLENEQARIKGRG